MKQRLLVAATGFGALWLAGRFVLGLPPDDFAQDYVMARAVRAGAQVYIGISQLTVRYLGFPPESTWVSNHPPSQIALVLPLSYLNFATARVIWFLLCLVALGALVSMAYRLIGRSQSRLGLVVATLAAMSWYPVRRELDLGQTIIVTSLCCAAAMLAYRSGRVALAGGLIGLTFWTKFLCWPVLLVFLARRDWRAFGAAVGVALSGVAIGGVLVGPGTVGHYIQTVLPADTDFFVGDPSNLSLVGTLARLFQGTGPAPFGSVVVPPLLHISAVALPLGVALSVLLAGWMAARSRHVAPEASIAIATCVGVIAGPLTWNFYLVVVAVPALLFLANENTSARVRTILLCALVPTFLFFDGWERAVSRFEPTALLVPLVGLAAVLPIVLGLARMRVVDGVSEVTR